MNLSVMDPVEHAVERVKVILFRPFDVSKWFVLGFCAFLAYLGEGGGYGGSYHRSYNDRHGPFHGGGFASEMGAAADWVKFHLLLVVVVGAIVLFLAVVLGVLFTWLRSRGRFMFLDGVVRNRAAVSEPWTQFAVQGNSLFLFSLVFGLIASAVIFGIIGAGLVLAWPDMRAGHWGIGTGLALIIGLPLLCVAISLCAIVEVLLEDFVVPTMYLRGERVLAAWGIVRREILADHAVTIFLYFLVKIMLAVAVGIIALVATCLTCCLAALPYLGTVILLPLFVFKRSYSLCFLEQLGPSWRFFGETLQPPLPPPFAPPPA